MNRDLRIGQIPGHIRLMCPFLLLGIVFSVPATASAGLVNVSAVQCGSQLVAQSGSSGFLTGQPIAPSAAGVCARALQPLQVAQRVSPNSARAEAWSGYISLSLGDPADAASAFDRSADLQPGDSIVWFFSGLAYERLGRREVAIRRWERIPEPTRAITTVANRLAAQGQCAEAVTFYRIALHRSSAGIEQAHLGLGDCFFEMERWTEAASEYQAALQMGLRSAAVANRLGNLLVQLSRPEEAISYLAQALEWHSYPWHMIDLAKAYEAAGNLASAEYWLIETERQFPQSSAGFWESGNYYLRHDRYQEAIPHYRDAVAVDPHCPFYCYSDLGRAYMAAGCHREAAEAFAEALRRDQGNAVVAKWLRDAEAMEAGSSEGCP